MIEWWYGDIYSRAIFMKRSLKQQAKDLPRTPGVYLFKDAAGIVLYVGKATSLRVRVAQYVSGQEAKSRGARMRRLMEEAVRVDVEETASALEALILEANLIKKHQPQYNVEQKDDKSFAYFVITRETFPRVVILRATDFDKAKYRDAVYAKGARFGPYTSTAQMRTALKILRKIFPFHARAEKSEKGCLAYQIGLCPGPYDGAITPVAYRRNMRGIRMMLEGKRTRLLASLRRAMEQSARTEQFEEAARLRDQIAALTHIRDVALMTRSFDTATRAHGGGDQGRIECYDMSHISGASAVGAMVVFHRGAPAKDQYRTFTIKHAQTDNDLAMMREVLARRMMHAEWAQPDAIVLDGGATHLAMAEELWQALGVRIPLLAVAKGPTRKNVDVYPSARFAPASALVENRALLEALREEAHRRAIGAHRRRRRHEEHLRCAGKGLYKM